MAQYPRRATIFSRPQIPLPIKRPCSPFLAHISPRLPSSSLRRKVLAPRKMNLSLHRPQSVLIPPSAIVSIALPPGLFGTMLTNSSPSSNGYPGASEASARRNFDRSLSRLPRTNGIPSTVAAHGPCYHDCPDKQHPLCLLPLLHPGDPWYITASAAIDYCELCITRGCDRPSSRALCK